MLRGAVKKILHGANYEKALVTLNDRQGWHKKTFFFGRLKLGCYETSLSQNCSARLA